MTGGQSLRIAVLVHRIGPYHHARFRALARKCDLRVVEYSSKDETYAWDPVPVSEYRVSPMFTDADVATKVSGHVWEKMCSTLASIRPDIVAIPGWSEPASLAALAWCRSHGTNAILMSETTEFDGSRALGKEWIKGRIVRGYSAALVGGTPHLKYAIRLGQRPGRVFLGYDVVDNSHFSVGAASARANAGVVRKRLGLPNDYFLASCRFVPKKNLDRLVTGFAQYVISAGEHAWDLVLLGDGPLKSTVQANLATLKIADRVHLPGFVQYQELPAYYGLAGAFIHASVVEQWGLVVNEAMAAGLPVIVSERCGCVADLVRDDVNGFRFDPLRPEALASRMKEIASGKYDLGAMGDASRQIIGKLSPETFAENLCDAARAALADRAAKASIFDRLLLWMAARR